MGCATSVDCPVKNHSSEKSCWEISFLNNDWEKVFEKCRYCKVFKLQSNTFREKN
jgi:hypothetical protein